MNLLSTINDWGKGTWFKLGFVETIITMVLFLVIAYILKKTISSYIKRHIKINAAFTIRIVKIILYTIAIYGCLSLLIPFDSVLGKIWGSAGIIAVVLGLAAQEAMGNVVNGLLISTFKPFKIGDLVKVNNGEYEGYVVDISLRDTVIQTYENTKVIIPNSTMNKAVLENVSQFNDSKANFLLINISYESDIDKAMSLISEEVRKHPQFIDQRSEEDKQKGISPVAIRLTSFNDSSLTLKTTIYSQNNAEGYVMLCDLRLAIKKRFDQEGIELPYPHRTIVDKRTEAKDSK